MTSYITFSRRRSALGLTGDCNITDFLYVLPLPFLRLTPHVLGDSRASHPLHHKEEDSNYFHF